MYTLAPNQRGGKKLRQRTTNRSDRGFTAGNLPARRRSRRRISLNYNVFVLLMYKCHKPREDVRPALM